MPKKRFTKSMIEKHDFNSDTFFMRELDMITESGGYEMAKSIQFFKDLELYGLDEAILYAEGYWPTEKVAKLKECANRIKEAIGV